MNSLMSFMNSIMSFCINSLNALNSDTFQTRTDIAPEKRQFLSLIGSWKVAHAVLGANADSFLDHYFTIQENIS